MTSLLAWLLVAMLGASIEGAELYSALGARDDDDPDNKTQTQAPACPKMCSCALQVFPELDTPRPLLVVNCSRSGLVEFPALLPSGTQVLDLSHNKLQNLSYLPQLPELLALDVSSNWMKQLDNHWVFEHVSKLRHLRLADNALSSLQHGSFSGLGDLKMLDLAHNIIRRVDTHAFSGLLNLEVLRLDENDLYQLKREWFLSLTSLQRLHAGKNLVAWLENDTFNKLSRLQHLDLSDNSLRDIPDNSLNGLHSLRLLNLSGNSNLREVPSKALRAVSGINILLLDGTSIERLASFSFSSLGVGEISLSFMPRLKVVERSAFHNLTNLRTLQLHDNPRLIYIHPSAFTSLPLLRHLLLHNNGLVAVPGQIVQSLPSLVDLHLHHNPLLCDCNVYWLRQELSLEHHYQPRGSISSTDHISTDHIPSTDHISTDHIPSTDHISSTGFPSSSTDFAVPSTSTMTIEIVPNRTYISEPGRVSCFFPAGNSSLPLIQLPMQYFSPTCPPTTLPLYPPSINASVGDELRLECHGLGVPTPSISWHLPGGRQLNSSYTPTKDDSIKPPDLLDENTLYIKSLTLTDSGTYICRAVNSLNEDVTATTVRVLNKPLTISDAKVGNDYITLSWKGSIPRNQMSDFQLFYKELFSIPNPTETTDTEVNTAEEPKPDQSTLNGFDVVSLHASVHKCTITGLKPLTTYQVCLVYKAVHTIQCNNYTTTQDVQVVRADGIVRVSKTQVGAGVASVFGVLLLVAVVLVVRKVRHRKDYLDPLAEEEKTNIPLEALPPAAPSTPLTSSRTALLTNSQI
ncbi:leucine-rich repeat-containing protein let-4-like [Physella acuta]|uniref:leucine-rich repeat-containing protein let-4-like n=1 Tax=Physella acuta TaxID=109671 RepID=UPI0027DD6FDA|nr:leucine-rich repeat-containing protein let-4-like [Physella acuta]XP_059141629.1 leucine-rich repeat-containing protein let-4-like [Physella acuta]